MSELKNGVMLTENALRCVAQDIELYYKKKAPNGAWCIATCRTAAAQFAQMRSELAELRRAQPEITGETSDGYHTFNELYHHRAVLFSVICNDRPTLAWKSKQHHDGTMYAGMFIVGIETPDGQATYHYDIEPYWDMFNVQELPQAPEWDGHTPTQAIDRIGKLCAQLENEPLALDELRGMDGECVWVENLSTPQSSGRHLVNANDDDAILVAKDGWRIPLDCLGNNRIAYRRKPERGEGE